MLELAWLSLAFLCTATFTECSDEARRLETSECRLSGIKGSAALKGFFVEFECSDEAARKLVEYEAREK